MQGASTTAGDGNLPRFVADENLGKLVKWLRLLGYDTLYEPGLSGEDLLALTRRGRVLLTRMTRLIGKAPEGPMVWIAMDDPMEQLRYVLTTLNLPLQEGRVFSRCLRCNDPVQPVERDSVVGRVPDYIATTHHRFTSCPRCGRIYWSGSHLRHSLEAVSRLPAGGKGDPDCET